jgi:soluble lytic murein transglycosylase-like protein
MRGMYRAGIMTGLLALMSLSAAADERAILRNGSTIRHARHETREDVTRLYMAGEVDNYIDIPTEEIIGYEEVHLPLEPVAVKAEHESTISSMSGSGGVDVAAAVKAASSRNNLNPDLINSMIRVESGFNPHAVSPKGAQGLMQLMPQTAARMGVADPFNPVENIEGGTRYIRELLDRYHLDLVKALAAYNAGPERVEQYHGVPPYPETIAYVSRVIRNFNGKQSAQNSAGGKTAAAHAKKKQVSVKSARVAVGEEPVAERETEAETGGSSASGS